MTQKKSPSKSAHNNSAYNKAVYIVDGSRTPFLKAKGKPGPFHAADLAVYAGRAVLARHDFRPAE